MIRFASLAFALAAPLLAQAATRAEVARSVMPASVRVQLLSGEKVIRTATGVVVASKPAQDGAPARAAVLTNAHVVDPANVENASWRVLVEKRGRVVKTHTAKLAGLGKVPEMDLAVVEVEAELPAASLGTEDAIDVGDEIVVVGAPYGRSLSVSGGMVSQLEAEEGATGTPLRYTAMKTDAAIGYGSSGGGVFHVPTGRLIGIVEGYRTARVAISDKMGFDIPMPGETFVAPITKVRGFLSSHLAAWAKPGAASSAVALDTSAPKAAAANPTAIPPQ